MTRAHLSSLFLSAKNKEGKNKNNKGPEEEGREKNVARSSERFLARAFHFYWPPENLPRRLPRNTPGNFQLIAGRCFSRERARIFNPGL